MKRTILVAAVLVQTAFVWAQSEPSGNELPEITVTASRIAEPTLDTPAFVTVISAEQIARSTGKDLAGILRSDGGVEVGDYGPRGALETLSVRGSTSAQVLVLVDGVRQNSPRDGLVDLSQIPLEMIDHIEILRGGESALYGADAVGGIVNIITRRPGRAHLSLRVENGSYLPRSAALVSEGMTKTPAPPDALDLIDTQRTALNASGTLGPIGLTAGGSFTRAANGYVFYDGEYSGGWRKQNRSALLSGSGYLGTRMQAAGGELSTRTSFLYSGAQVSGPLSGFALTTHALQKNTSASETVRFSTPRFLSDALDLQLTGFYRLDRLNYTDPSQVPPVDSTHTTQRTGVDLTQKLTLSDYVSIVYGADAEYDFVDSSDIGRLSRTSAAGFVAIPFSPLPALTLTPSVRYDYYSDFTGGISYRLGLVYLTGDNSAIKASAGESYRVPTLNDMYWPGPWTPGNPDLEPETACHADLGYTVRSGALSLDTALFVRYMFGQILWGPTGDPIMDPWTPQNLGQSLVPGVELHAAIELSPSVSLRTDYTFMYSLLLADAARSYRLVDDRRVPYVPLHSVTVGLRWSRGGTEIDADMHYTGKQYTDTANTESSALSSYVVFNALLRRELSKHLSLSIAGRNLFNESYSTQAGYAMPPFSLWTAIELRM